MWNVPKTQPLFGNDEAPSSSSQRFDFVRPAPANRAHLQVSRESFLKNTKQHKATLRSTTYRILP